MLNPVVCLHVATGFFAALTVASGVIAKIFVPEYAYSEEKSAASSLCFILNFGNGGLYF